MTGEKTIEFKVEISFLIQTVLALHPPIALQVHDQSSTHKSELKKPGQVAQLVRTPT